MDWNAGVPPATSPTGDVKPPTRRAVSAFSCFALMQAGTLALQSHVKNCKTYHIV